MPSGLEDKPQAGVEVRRMEEPDLADVASILDLAFGAVIETLYGRKVAPPLFSSQLCPYRHAADPAGCHVATVDGQIVGVNFSVTRGTVGWFGPLAVTPQAQGRGIAQQLVKEFIRSSTERGARILGLETFPSSPLHVNLYGKLGFRPSWTGVGFRRELAGSKWPGDVDIDASIPDLDYLYTGYDPAKEVAATRSAKVGVTLTSGRGFALCHVSSTLWNDPTIAHLGLLVAPDRETFDRLMAAVEDIARKNGKSAVATEVPGSSWNTQQALVERGYRAGTAALRMKMGERLDYDGGPSYYCDDWH